MTEGERDEARRLLVLDDEPDVRDLMRFIFRPLGYEIFTTESGVEALALLGKVKVAVALVDLLMPAMSGKDFIEKLRDLPAEMRPVVIVSSARRPEEVRSEISGADVYQVLSKPFDLGDIEEKVAGAFHEKIRRLSQAGSKRA